MLRCAITTASLNIYLSLQTSTAAQRLLSWPSLRPVYRTAPRRTVFSFLCWAIISIFFHFIQFLETAAGGEVDRTLTFISFFHLFTDSAKLLRASACACRYLPNSSVRLLLTLLLLPWRSTRVGWNYRKTKT